MPLMIHFLKRNWILISLSFVIILILLFTDRPSFIKSTDDLQKVMEHELVDDHALAIKTDGNDQEMERIMVDVKGAVHHPGVYEVEPNQRIKDVISLAGGFTKDADELAVNLAQRVHDEMVIYVPQHLEDNYAQQENSHESSAKVRINYATKEELETITGIGPARAEAILKYREENGFFKQVEDLLHVSGIGEKLLEQMKDEIQVP